MKTSRFAVAATALVLAACGAVKPVAPSRPVHHVDARRAVHTTRAILPLQALVTAQTENRLLLVDLPRGRVVRSVTLPGAPSYVDGTARVVVAVSSDSGAVRLLDRTSLRVIRVFRGFSSPHIPAISPDGQYAYVTDDGSGQVAVIGLYNDRLISRIFVGAGAHHLAFTPGERQVWVALSQAADTITILSTVVRMPSPPPSPVLDASRPHVIGYFHPPFLAHDLLFTPSGRAVWITSANTSYVGVFSVRTRRLLFRVPAGAPPQHLAFSGRYAYITSGYGSSIEQVDLYTGHVIRKVYAPYGSFDLDAAGGYVVTASLLRGTLAIYDRQLRLLHIRALAPSTEDVALSAG